MTRGRAASGNAASAAVAPATVQPLAAFLVFDGQGVGVDSASFGWPIPVLLVEHADENTVSTRRQCAVQIKTSRSSGIPERPEPRGRLQRGKIDRRGVLDREDYALSAAMFRGGPGERLQQVVGRNAFVLEEAINGLGGVWIAAGLGNTVKGFLGKRGDNLGKAAVEPLVRQVRSGTQLRRPDVGFQAQERGCHP